MDRNPYVPPKASLAEARPAGRAWPRYVIAALAAVELMASLRYGWAFFELVRVGAVRPIGLLLALPASGALYAAAILAVRESPRARRWFLVAAVGLCLATPIWWGTTLGVPHPWSVVVAFGALPGVAGYGLTPKAKA